MASSNLINKHGVRLAGSPVQWIFHSNEKLLRASCLSSCETPHRATTFFEEFCQFPWLLRQGLRGHGRHVVWGSDWAHCTKYSNCWPQNAYATLKRRPNERKLSVTLDKNLSRFKFDESGRESPRAHESLRPNKVESLNSHQLSATLALIWPRLKSPQWRLCKQSGPESKMTFSFVQVTVFLSKYNSAKLEWTKSTGK